MLSTRDSMLDTQKAVKNTDGMLSMASQKERPTCVNAGGALFVLGGDRLVAKDAGATSPKRQFEPGSPHQTSGTVAALTAPVPDHQPRDRTPRKMTASRYIARRRSVFQNAVLSHMTDRTRREHSPSPKAN